MSWLRKNSYVRRLEKIERCYKPPVSPSLARTLDEVLSHLNYEDRVLVDNCYRTLREHSVVETGLSQYDLTEFSVEEREVVRTGFSVLLRKMREFESKGLVM